MRQEKQKSYYSLPLYFVFSIYFFTALISHSFYLPYSLFIVSVFLCTFPNLFSRRMGLGKSILIEFLFLYITAFYLGQIALIIITIMAFLGLLSTLKIIWKNRLEEVKEVPDILGIIVLAFFTIHFFGFMVFLAWITKQG